MFFWEARSEIIRASNSENGVKIDLAIINWPIPKTPKALRGFLGLTRYYMKFVKGYGALLLL